MLSSVRRRVAKEHGTFKNSRSREEETKEHGVRRWGQVVLRQHTTTQIVGTFLLVAFLLLYIFYPISVVLIGDGYQTEGGILGKAADRCLGFLHHRRHRSSEGIEFPLVILRSNRKQIPGYSRYLEEILSQHSENTDSWPRIISNTVDSSPERSTNVVQMVEIDDGRRSTRRKRVPLLQQLYEKGCRPGWFCHRCLNSGFIFGSLENCRAFCPSCYEDLLCHSKTTASISSIQVVTRNALTRIPRIVHQAWKEPLDPLQYPELVRIQQAWRHSGYRFYTPDLAQDFVQRHYPSQIWHIYHSIEDWDVQLNLFRLLVLFAEGGVFANVDLMLETNLDAILTPNLSFLAARDDGPGDHCLWDGLIGASPGHPFVARAIELFIENLCDRSVERVLCQFQGPSVPLWKGRTFPLEHQFGSCALGMAVHKGLGHNDLMEDFQLGSFSSRTDNDSLILMMSRDDTGAFRCTDIERNLLVASTGMLGLTTQSMSERTGLSSLRTKSLDPKGVSKLGYCDSVSFDI